jgi:nucleotide-binding universal stress UspA family protein
MSSLRRILVPFDFSAPAARALHWTADLRKQLRGTSVHVVHVWDLVPAAMLAAPQAAGPSDEDVGAVERDLRAACQKCDLEATVSVEPAPHVGDAIVAVARRIHADLIVMGTHGRGGLTRAVLGSVADQVVRRADCPVTVVTMAG